MEAPSVLRQAQDALSERGESKGGFEPEMIGPESLSCCLALLAGRPYSPVLTGMWALLFPKMFPIH
jgi:hypothetical protein